eukprot:4599313-Pyramimonas_sp.AAC.1
MQLQSFFASGLEVLAALTFQSLIEQVGREATAMRKRDQKAAHQAWMRFQRAACQDGASDGHR